MLLMVFCLDQVIPNGIRVSYNISHIIFLIFFWFMLEVTWEDQQKKVNGTITDDKPLPKKKHHSEPGLSGF